MQLSIVSGQHTYQIRPQPKPVEQPLREENTPVEKPINFVKSSESAIALLERRKEQEAQSAIYDKPSFKNGNAIYAYKSVQNDQRRSEIETLIGVNLYA
ncbi:hypothetical protein PALB_15000 [Pseudoalteromonas luteoviolacea B = ATCC 29581]|nr:hypothetical protein PALB_15000 [Pseudoalteromonas luteoviolacea B = ATCC 29581]